MGPVRKNPFRIPVITKAEQAILTMAHQAGRRVVDLEKAEDLIRVNADRGRLKRWLRNAPRPCHFDLNEIRRLRERIEGAPRVGMTGSTPLEIQVSRCRGPLTKRKKSYAKPRLGSSMIGTCLAQRLCSVARCSRQSG